MRIITLLIAALIFTSQGSDGPEHSGQVVELPRPSSVELNRNDGEKYPIFQNQPSGPLKTWKNPYLGFAVHVTSEDNFIIYSILSDERFHPEIFSTVEDIQKFERGIWQLGNPHGILITSERPLKDSKTFPTLFQALFKPQIQLFFLQSQKKQ